jgi:hypothetical protein
MKCPDLDAYVLMTYITQSVSFHRFALTPRSIDTVT